MNGNEFYLTTEKFKLLDVTVRNFLINTSYSLSLNVLKRIVFMKDNEEIYFDFLSIKNPLSCGAEKITRGCKIISVTPLFSQEQIKHMLKIQLKEKGLIFRKNKVSFGEKIIIDNPFDLKVSMLDNYVSLLVAVLNVENLHLAS